MGTGKGRLTQEDIDKMNAAVEREAIREMDEIVIRQLENIYDSLLREAGIIVVEEEDEENPVRVKRKAVWEMR